MPEEKFKAKRFHNGRENSWSLEYMTEACRYLQSLTNRKPGAGAVNKKA